MEILVVSDLHVGSRYAVMPSVFGNFRANKVQKQILKKWREMCKAEKKPDYLVVNGDAVDGVGYASNGKEQWTTDKGEQIDAAVELVKEIDCDNVLVTYGSKYHTEENLNLDEAFARQVGAKHHGWEISLNPEGTKSHMHFSHQISVSTSVWQYRTTPLAKELVAALLNENVLPKYDVIGRAHAHYFCQVAFTSSMAFVGPCWQTRTPYMIRKGLALIPKLGYVKLSSEDGERWNLTAKTFDIPKPEVVS
jgi:hypothetical protein